jgi:hypothetical protein
MSLAGVQGEVESGLDIEDRRQEERIRTGKSTSTSWSSERHRATEQTAGASLTFGHIAELCLWQSGRGGELRLLLDCLMDQLCALMEN